MRAEHKTDQRNSINSQTPSDNQSNYGSVSSCPPSLILAELHVWKIDEIFFLFFFIQMEEDKASIEKEQLKIKENSSFQREGERKKNPSALPLLFVQAYISSYLFSSN